MTYRSSGSFVEYGLILGILCIVGFNVAKYANQNAFAKKFGGTQTITLDVNKELENATWKEDDLWVLIRDRKTGEEANTHYFKEYSNFGVLQGTVVIVER